MLFVHAHMVASKAVFVLIKRNQSKSQQHGDGAQFVLKKMAH
jgi:hypothetical protein